MVDFCAPPGPLGGAFRFREGSIAWRHKIPEPKTRAEPAAVPQIGNALLGELRSMRH